MLTAISLSNDVIRHLRAADKRIAHMHLAGIPAAQIALFMQTSQGSITAVLEKEAVQRYILQQHAMMSEELRPWAEDMRKTLEEKANRAVEVLSTVMEDSFQEREDIKRARLASMNAKDILDMAGARAPKRVEVGEPGSFSIGNDEANAIIEILREDISRKG